MWRRRHLFFPLSGAPHPTPSPASTHPSAPVTSLHPSMHLRLIITAILFQYFSSSLPLLFNGFPLHYSSQTSLNSYQSLPFYPNLNLFYLFFFFLSLSYYPYNSIIFFSFSSSSFSCLLPSFFFSNISQVLFLCTSCLFSFELSFNFYLFFFLHIFISFLVIILAFFRFFLDFLLVSFLFLFIF